MASAANLISQAPRFAITRDEARHAIDDLHAVVAARWREYVLERGGSPRDIDAIESAFTYPGFHFDS